MKNKLITILVCLSILGTLVPVSAEENDAIYQDPVETTALTVEETELGFVLNGGSFVDGYEAPTSYPTTSLPTSDDIVKEGYSFAGWYDNEEFEGDKITSLDTSDHSGNVVLYAKWKDTYYYVDIPETVDVNKDTINVTAKAEGLYEGDTVLVDIQSKNDWQLKSGKNSLNYQLLDVDTNDQLQNDSLVLNLTKENDYIEKQFKTRLVDSPKYTGNYTDQLTFNVSYSGSSYTIQYESNGGTIYEEQKDGTTTTLTQEVYDAGITLDDLPYPIKKGATFLGWCYDEACTDYVDSRDRLLSNITLYASYMDNKPLEPTIIDTYARAIDTEPNFVIQITDKSGTLTPDEILASTTIKNLSDTSEAISLTITEGADHIFTIGSQDGWKRGSSYKLTIDNDSLYFTGFDETITEYDFSIYKEDVSNVSLNKDIKYIKIKDISNLIVNGEKASEITIATLTLGTDGTVIEDGTKTTGSFTYTNQSLEVGDLLAVYSGDVIPTMELSGSSDTDISFLEITKVDGTTYSYRGAKTEDVLFMPEVLPLDKNQDLDGDFTNNSVTVPTSVLTFNSEDEMSKALELDEDTTVDVGDYLSLYEDVNDSNNVSYGEITTVTLYDGNYVITYEPVDWDTVKATMDVYETETVEGESLLEGTNKEELEDNIEQQALESGFVDEVVQTISAVAMETESFQDLQKTISDELGAEISIQSNDDIEGYASIAPVKQARVECEPGPVKANLSTTLQHFDGNLSGIHLGLEVSATVSILLGTKKTDCVLQFTVTAKFEQEVRVDINVDGEAVWKTWGIFPYIADYRVTASLDLYEYTGIGFDLNVQLVDRDNVLKSKSKLIKKVNKITTELKDMMEKGQDTVTSLKNLHDALQDDEVAFSEGEDEDDDYNISVAKGLAERYSEMLETDSDWVEIFKKQLLSHHQRILLIIDIEIKLEFVVSANVNVSLGMTYWYKNAKRYVFCLRIKDGTATSDTIDLVEEQYEFTAYAMGVLGLRAGVRLTVRVGLLSTSLASVGLIAEVGGYAKVYGYLYYELKYTASSGRNTSAMGALYLEIGIYLEIKFEAQALANSVSYTPTLYENEWPLYTVGNIKNVVDYNYEQEEVEEIKMKRLINSVKLSDDFFTMQYINMKTGLDDGNYYTQNYEDNASNYSIVMTNKAFSYDPDKNIISVDTTTDSVWEDGEMIITWKDQEGTFRTKPLQRTIKLHWDNLRYSSYYIAFDSNGGSYIPTIDASYNAEITKPKDPTREGYTFVGWYSDEALTIPYDFPSVMPNQDAYVYAKWEAKDVNYTINNYVESVTGVYEAETPIVLQAKTDSVVNYDPTIRNGFYTPSSTTTTVKADGSTEINNYYTRNKYKVTFLSDGEVVSEGYYKFGKTMPTPALYKPGYSFASWDQTVSQTVLNHDVTYNAIWEPDKGIPYQVKYYVQTEDGLDYKLSEVDTFTGTMDTEVTAPDGGFDTSIYHLKGELPKGIIKADGSLVLRVYYDLNTYTLTYETNGGTLDESEMTVSAPASQQVSLPLPTRQGYLFEGWYLDEDFNEAFTGSMLAKDSTVYAKWSKQKTTYTVNHYYAKLPEDNSKEMTEGEPTNGYDVVTEVKTAEVETEVIPEVRNETGFEFRSSAEPVTIAADGSTVVDYYYWRNSYELEVITPDVKDPGSYDENDSSTFEMYGRPFQFGEQINIENEIGIPGYTLIGLYKDPEFKEEFTEKTMPDPTEYGSSNAYIITVYAKYEVQDVSYTVKYLGEDLNCNYTVTLFEEQHLIAKTDTVVEGDLTNKDVVGYTTPSVISATVSGNGDTCIEYHYKRNSYTVTYVTYDGDETNVKSGTWAYETEVNYVPYRKNYAFDGWYTDEALTQAFDGKMPSEDIKLYASWIQGQRNYQVQYALQSLTDETKFDIVTSDTQTFKGSIDTKISDETLDPKTYDGFTTPDKQTLFMYSNTDEIGLVTYQYTRNKYRVTYVKNNGTEDTIEELYYGSTISNLDSTEAPNGCEFDGWYLNKELTEPFDGIVPSSDITLYAKWIGSFNEVYYYHWVESLKKDANGNPTYEERPISEGIIRDVRNYTTIPVMVKDIEGFTSPQEQTITVTPEGNTKYNTNEINYYYTRNSYELVIVDPKQNIDTKYELKYGETIPTQTREGYSFAGYYTDPEFKVPYTGSMPAEDTKLYVNWTPKKVSYSIKICKNDTGKCYVSKTLSALSGSTVKAGEDYTIDDITNYVSPEARSIKDAVVSGDGETVITLDYYRPKTTVTLRDSLDSTIITELTNYVGSSLEVANPTKIGYAFAGWTIENDEKNNVVDIPSEFPSESITYVAQWEQIFYKLSFNTDGGDSINDITGNYGDEITIPKTASGKEGYTFDHWKTGGETVDVSTLTTMPANNVTLTAIWTKKTYTITYKDVTESFTSNAPKTYDVSINEVKIDNPTKTGYTFAGWTTNKISTKITDLQIKEGKIYYKNSKNEQVGVFYENLTLTANWEEKTYSINFCCNRTQSGNNGSGIKIAENKNMINVKYSELVKSTLNGSATRTGYTFVGWSTKDDGNINYYNGDKITDSMLEEANDNTLKLYPVWQANTYKVSFWNDEGKTTGSWYPKVAYNSSYIIVSNPTRKGYTFNGWKFYDGKNTNETVNEVVDDVEVKAGNSLKMTYANDIGWVADWTANRKASWSHSESVFVDDNQKDNNSQPKFSFKLDDLNGISYKAVHSSFNTMFVNGSYKLVENREGYADIRLYAYKAGSSEATKIGEWTVDTSDYDGKEVQFLFSYIEKNGKIPFYKLMIEFDAHGNNDDNYYASDIKVNVKFSNTK